MGLFKGKTKRGLSLVRVKRRPVYSSRRQKQSPDLYSPFKSPFRKKQKTSTPSKHINEEYIRTSTPAKSKRRLNLPKITDFNEKSFEDPTEYIILDLDDTINYSTFIDTKDAKTLDNTTGESRDEQTQTETDDLMSLLSQALDSLDKNELRQDLLTFLKLLSEGAFPLDNVAFLLFIDVVKWFASNDSRAMRYGETTMKFFWLGKKLFGGRFLRFMSGPKNETDFLVGKRYLSPSTSKINFACPSDVILREFNPLGLDKQMSVGPGLITDMIDLKSKKDSDNMSYVLMFDGKKIKRGADADLLGFEEGDSLKDRQEILKRDIKIISDSLQAFKEVSRAAEDVNGTHDQDKHEVYEKLSCCLKVFSLYLKQMRFLRKSKDAALARYKDQISKDASMAKTLEYAIDSCRTSIYQIENCVSVLLDAQWHICRTGACLNNVLHLFATEKTIELSDQLNFKRLKDVSEITNSLPDIDGNYETCFIKQRSPKWFEARKAVKVTGSSVYAAIGCDSLKRQLEHFDSVFSNVEKRKPNEAQSAAMNHGVISEDHQIATLTSIIMPFLFPNLTFHEEGYYVERQVIVSPDGSLRTEDGRDIVFAFEGKAPVGNQYTTKLHYEVPERYITQTVYEQTVLKAEMGTIYLCWTPESTTVFKVPENKELYDTSMEIIDNLYHGQVPKRPTRLSKESKQMKDKIKEHVQSCEFIGEFPSVRAKPDIGLTNKDTNFLSSTGCYYSELIKSVLKANAAIKDAYNLQRKYASQVLVYLLADLDRMWKQEEPHAVPVMYVYRGYSLSMDVARKLMDYCRKACIDKGIDVVVTSSDGEFITLMARNKNGEPLTLYQLSKDVWHKTCKMKKTEIVKLLQLVNRHHKVSVGANRKIVLEAVTDGAPVSTPSRGWKKKDTKEEQKTKDTCSEIMDIQSEELLNIGEEQMDTNNSIDTPNNTMQINKQDLDQTLPYDFENLVADINAELYHVTPEEADDMLHLLRQVKRSKWTNVRKEVLLETLQNTDKLKKMIKAELIEISKYLNLKLIGTTNQLKIKGVSKVDLVNQLSNLLGDKVQLEQQRKRKRKHSGPKSLKELASACLLKQSFPKQVLNIAYATYIWPKEVKQWRKNGRVEERVEVKHTGGAYFEPYYIPDFDSEENDFNVFTYDKTHLGTNLRKCICLNKVEGISVNAWKKVADTNPKILHPSLIEVSPEGKIQDQMKEKLARTMVSREVEMDMIAHGYNQEAEFCHVIREGLYVADDTPGISSAERCNKRLALINWLARGTNFGSFPPYGGRIKGLSSILYEGLRSSQEAKLYLYALANSGTYCVRAPNTLCSESFFGSMQEMDPWGQGILSASGVEKHISDFTTVTSMKMEENRNIFIKTKADAAYPVPKMFECSRAELDKDPCDDTSKCMCRKNKHISCIVPRDHFFDTPERARITKQEKPYTVNKPDGTLRGEQPIRSQYGYKMNQSKMLPSKRLSINLDGSNRNQ